MSKLTTGERDKLPKDEFAGPGRAIPSRTKRTPWTPRRAHPKPSKPAV